VAIDRMRDPPICSLRSVPLGRGARAQAARGS